MSAIKSIDLSGITDNFERIKTIVQTVFGISVTEKKSQEITLFGELKMWLNIPTYGGVGVLYQKQNGRQVLFLGNDSSAVYYIVGDYYVSMWGSNASGNQLYRNCIVKITEKWYLFTGTNQDQCIESLDDVGTLFGVYNSAYQGSFPTDGDDAYVAGMVIPLFHLSAKKEYNFVSDKCFWVTRAGDLLSVGSEVTVGDETYIILTQGSQMIPNNQVDSYYLAVRKE